MMHAMVTERFRLVAPARLEARLEEAG